MHVSAVIAAGGRGLRFGGFHPKQLATLAGRSILQRSVDAFCSCRSVTEVVVVVPPELEGSWSPMDPARRVELVGGGPRRRDSVANGFHRVADRADIVVVHDAARPLVTEAVIERTIAAAAEYGAAIAAIPARDTVKRVSGSEIGETLPREAIFLAQTPQAFRTAVLRDALTMAGDATDEAMLAEQAGHRVRVVAGDPRNIKITTPEDLAIAERLLGEPTSGAALRIGNGYDLHRLVPGRPLVLGGVTIPFDKGLEGHSDADAVCHAVIDAVLGAAGLGDVGRLYPDTDPAWKDADSIELLRHAAGLVRSAGFSIVNVDVVVVAERPKIVPHVEAMRTNVARGLGCEPSRVSVKGKTNEGMDSMGAGQSIAVHAVALVHGASAP